MNLLKENFLMTLWSQPNQFKINIPLVQKSVNWLALGIDWLVFIGSYMIFIGLK